MALPTQQQQEDIAGLYAAFWNRAPDAGGFGYWVDKLATGTPLTDIAQYFLDSPEGERAYPKYLTADSFVAQVYSNVFDRAPDAEGQAYWEGILAQPGMTKAGLVAAMANSAVQLDNDDGKLFENKIATGIYVATDVLSGNVTAEQTTAITTNAFRYLTADVASLETTAVYLSHLPTGTPYELTVNQDTWNGDAGNDLFIANLAAVNGTTYNTLTIGDRLNGGYGYDVLDVTLVTNATDSFTLQSIDEVQVEAVANVTLTNAFVGVEEVVLEDTVGYGVTLSGFTGNVDASVYNSSNAFLAIQGADTVAAQTLTLDTANTVTVTLNDGGVAGSTPVFNILAQGGASDEVTVLGDILDATTLNVTAMADVTVASLGMTAIKNINVVGDSDVDMSQTSTLGNAGSGLITVNAIAATGNVSIDINSVTGRSLSADFGVGNDTLDITAMTATTLATVSVDMGAGDDTVEVRYSLPGNTNVSLDGGIGENDTLVISGVATAAQLNDLDFTYGTVQGFETLNFVSGTITVTAAANVTLSDGFNTVDFSDITTFAFGTNASLEISNLADNATLAFDAVSAVAGATTGAAFDLTIDAGGALSFEFNDNAIFEAGASVANDWTFTNATSLDFDFNSATADIDVTLDFGIVDGGPAYATLFADNVTTISVTGGSVASFFDFDLSGISTATSDLSALTTIDFSDFAGTLSMDLGSDQNVAVIANDLTIILNDGVAGYTDGQNVALITASDQGDTFEFQSTLVGEVEILNFNNDSLALNADILDVSAFGVTSVSQLSFTLISGSTYGITSDLFEGQITVELLNTGVGPATSIGFIFA